MIAGPQENSSLYTTFYNEILKMLQNKDHLLKMAVLSDGGTGLRKVIDEFKLLHYLCIHHLIKIIGANSFLAKVASKILMSQTEKKFIKNFNNALEIANSYMKSKERVISQKFLKTSFMKKIIEENGEEKIVSDIESNQDLVIKSVLCFRGFVAAA